MARPKNLGVCSAQTGREANRVGQLADLLSGLSDFLGAVLQEYSCNEIRAIATSRGGLRVKVCAPVEAGPAAVADNQHGWLLDVTISNGNAMEWTKLLSTPLVALPAAQQQRRQQQHPPQHQVLLIQQAAAAALWHLARHLKLHEAQLQDMQQPAGSQTPAGSSQPDVISELLQTAGCAFYSRLLWHLSNKYRPSAQQLQEHAGQLTPASLWMFVAAPPYAQHTAAIHAKQWATEVCSLLALLHQLQLLEVGDGRRQAVVAALHRLLQTATTPPAQLPPCQKKGLTQEQEQQVLTWLAAYGVQLEHILIAAEAEDLPNSIGICCHCGDVDDNAHDPPTRLIPCRSCVHEYHLGCARSDCSKATAFALAPDRKQLQPGADGRGVCLACQGFPLSEQCWQQVYGQEAAAAPVSGAAVLAAAAGKAASQSLSGKAAAATKKKQHMTAAGAGGGDAAAAAAAAADNANGVRLSPADQAAAAAALRRERAAAAALAAHKATGVSGRAHAEKSADGGTHEEQGWDFEDHMMPIDGTQINGTLLPTQDLAQGKSATAAATAAAGDSDAAAGGYADAYQRRSGSHSKSVDGSSSSSSEQGGEGGSSGSGSSSSSTGSESSSSEEGSSSSDSAEDNRDKAFQPSSGQKQKQLRKAATPPSKQQHQQQQLPVQEKAARPRGRPKAAAVAAAAAATGSSPVAPSSARRKAKLRKAAAAAEQGPDEGRRALPAAGGAAAAALAAGVAGGSGELASPVRGPRRAAAANAAAAIAAQAAADQQKGLGRGMGSPVKQRQQAAAHDSLPPPKGGRLAQGRAAVGAAAAAAAAAETPMMSPASQTFSGAEAAAALMTLFADLQQHEQQHGSQDDTGPGTGAAGTREAAARGGPKGGANGQTAAAAAGKNTPKKKAAGTGAVGDGLPAPAAAADEGGDSRQGLKRGRKVQAAEDEAAAAVAAAASNADTAPAAKRQRVAAKLSQQLRQQSQQEEEEEEASQGQAHRQWIQRQLLNGQQQQQEEGQGAMEVDQQQQGGHEGQQQHQGADRASPGRQQRNHLPTGQQRPHNQQDQHQLHRQLQRQNKQLGLIQDQDVLSRLRRRALLLLNAGAHRLLQRQLLMLLGEESQGVSKLVAVTLLALFAPAAGAPGGGASTAARVLAANAAAVLKGSKAASTVCLGTPAAPSAAAGAAVPAAAAGGLSRRVSVGSAGAEQQALHNWDWDALAATGAVGPLVALLEAQAQLQLLGNQPVAAECAGTCLKAFASLYYQVEANQEQQDEQQHGRGRGRGAADRAGTKVQAAAGSQQQQQGLLGLRREALMQVLVTGRQVLSQLHEAARSSEASAAAAVANAGAAGSPAAAEASGLPVCGFGGLAGQLLSAAAAAVADGASSRADLLCCKDTCQQLLQLGHLLSEGLVQQMLTLAWQPVQEVVLSQDTAWGTKAYTLQGLHGFLHSCMHVDADQPDGENQAEGGNEQGDGNSMLQWLNLQALPTGMARQLLLVLGAAGELSAQVQQQHKHPNGNQQQGGEHHAVAVQEREAGVQQVLPALYRLLQDALRRLAASVGQQEELLAGVVLFARKALQMAGAVLGVLLLPDACLGEFVLELQEGVGKGVAQSTVDVLRNVVQDELASGCYYNAAEALRWWADDCERVLRNTAAGADGAGVTDGE